jgi:hypothetical protein
MAGSLWGTTPRQSIEAACARLGARVVIRGCVTLLGGEDVGPELIEPLAGPDQVRFLDAPDDQRYWLRVWGARGLLWALGTPQAPAADTPWVVDAVVGALGDEHWRVREMAAKVVARYRLDAAQPAIVVLLADGTPRVRTAAARALRLLPP